MTHEDNAAKSPDDLIDGLCTDLQPVTRVANPVQRSFAWLVAGILCVGAGVSLSGFRPDLAEVAIRPGFLFESAAALAIAVVAAMGAFVLSVPSTEPRPLARWLVGLPLAIWTLQLSGRILFATDGLHTDFFWSGYGCSAEILALGFFPGILLYLMIKRAAPTRLGWTGALAALAVTALAAFGMQFSCQMGDPLHLLAWHFLPIVLVGALGVALGRRFLRW